MKMGQAPTVHTAPMLYDMLVSGKIDPTDIVTHRVPLTDNAQAYGTFHDHEDECIKFILKP